MTIKMMSIQHGDVTVVSARGNLDATTFTEAKSFLGAEIEQGHTQLVIDMQGVTYLSSAGLRVILATMQQARGAGGDVRLVVVEGNIKRVVDSAGFTKIIKTFTATKEAMASYGA